VLRRFYFFVWFAIAAGVTPASASSLSGKLLVAKPDMRDPNFGGSVVFLIDHGPAGAFGIIVNRPVRAVPVPRVFELFDLPGAPADGTLTLYRGGPVQPEAAVVLHSPDYRGEGTQVILDRFAVTPVVEVLRAMAKGTGPRDVILALGYAGWAPGQLEAELAREAWVVVPAAPDLVFHGDEEGKWRRALDRQGVDL